MDIRALEAFVAVAEEQSFSAGADRVFMTQSAVSKDIKKLEAELGVTLFDRSSRRIRLTAAGDLLLPRAKALLEQYRGILHAVRGEAPLRIAMLPVADSYGFPQLLAEFSSKDPGAALRLEEKQNAAIMQLLEEDRIDGGFCRILGPFRPEPHMVLFRRERLVLLVPDEGQPDAQAELSHYRNRRFIFLERDTGLWDASMALCLEAGFTPDICYTGSSRRNIARLVQEGTGVALLAQSVAEECRQEGLRLLQLTHSAESSLVFACTRRSGRLEQMSRLIAYLKNSRGIAP